MLNQATEVLTAIAEESSIWNYRDSETILSAFCTFSILHFVRNVLTYLLTLEDVYASLDVNIQLW